MAEMKQPNAERAKPGPTAPGTENQTPTPGGAPAQKQAPAPRADAASPTAKAASAKKRPTRHRGRLTALVLVAVVAIVVFLTDITIPESLHVQSQVEDYSGSLLTTASNNVQRSFLGNEETIRNFDNFRQERVDASAVYLDALPAEATPDLATMAEKSDAYDIYLLDAAGNQLSSASGQPLTVQNRGRLNGLLIDGAPFSEDTIRYYTSTCGRGRLVVAFSSMELEQETDPDQQVRSLLVDTDADDHAQVLAVSTDTGELISQNEAINGHNLSETELSMEELAAGHSGWCTIGGIAYFCVSRPSDHNYILVAAIEIFWMLGQVAYAVIIPGFVFLLVVLAVLIYAGILLYDPKAAETGCRYRRVAWGVYWNETYAVKLLPIALAGLILLTVSSGYEQMLRAYSHQGYNSLGSLDALAAKLDDNAQKVKQINDSFDQSCIEQAHYAAWMLQANPALLAEDSLQKLSDAFGAESIYVFNGVGRVEATNTDYKNYALSTNEDDPSYRFWSILKGDADDVTSDIPYAQAKTEEDASAFETLMKGGSRQRQGCLAGTRRLETAGVVRLAYSTELLSDKLDSLSPEVTIELMDLGENANLLVANASDNTIGYWQQTLSTPADAFAVGMQKTAFQNKYIGRQNIFGQSYFVVTHSYGDVYLCSAVNTGYLLRNLKQITTITFWGGFATLLLLILLSVVSVGKQPRPGEEKSADPQDVALPYGRLRDEVELHNKWSGVEQSWAESTPEQKYSRVLGVMGTVAVLFVAFNAFVLTTSSESRAVSAIIRGQWLRGVNIFSLSTILMIFSFVLVGSWMARRLLVQIGRSMGPHSETVCRLLSSAVKYVAIICTTFYCLNYIGIETKTLLASAGVLTVVIGIGAQSLVGDLLAGISIVFEGEFRVGDIIAIGDWRGTVLEIGLRTTKVEDRDKNIKVFNNATITGVVNMTQEYSYAICDVGIDYNESLERVENVLQEEFPHIRSRISKMVSGPVYAGVIELGESSVVIRITAQTLEGDRIPVTRALNREIKLAFDRHGISIPFPQVVVHPADDSDGPQEVTPEEQRRARRFANRQSRLANPATVQPAASVTTASDAAQAEGEER